VSGGQVVAVKKLLRAVKGLNPVSLKRVADGRFERRSSPTIRNTNSGVSNGLIGHGKANTPPIPRAPTASLFGSLQHESGASQTKVRAGLRGALRRRELGKTYAGKQRKAYFMEDKFNH